MLYYEDTKLGRRKRGPGTDINKYIGLAAKALVVDKLIVGCGKIW